MAVTDEDKLWAVLGYLGILCLLPLLLKKDRSFVQFHAKQGLVMLIVCVALWIAFIPFAILMLVPVIGWIIGGLWYLIMAVVGLAVFVLWIIAIINVIQGKTWKMPVLGGFAERIKF